MPITEFPMGQPTGHKLSQPERLQTQEGVRYTMAAKRERSGTKQPGDMEPIPHQASDPDPMPKSKPRDDEPGKQTVRVDDN
jgi:hypothetical protein